MAEAKSGSAVSYDIVDVHYVFTVALTQFLRIRGKYKAKPAEEAAEG